MTQAFGDDADFTSGEGEQGFPRLAPDLLRPGMDQDVHMLGRIVLNAGDFNFSLFRSGDNGIN